MFKFEVSASEPTLLVNLEVTDPDFGLTLEGAPRWVLKSGKEVRRLLDWLERREIKFFGEVLGFEVEALQIGDESKI